MASANSRRVSKRREIAVKFRQGERVACGHWMRFGRCDKLKFRCFDLVDAKFAPRGSALAFHNFIRRFQHFKLFCRRHELSIINFQSIRLQVTQMAELSVERNNHVRFIPRPDSSGQRESFSFIANAKNLPLALWPGAPVG